MARDGVIDALLGSDEPSVRYRVVTGVLGEDADSGRGHALREEVRRSSRVKALLSERIPDGRLPFEPYDQWYGAHWVLVTLAELGYPPDDSSLVPLREQVLAEWLSEEHIRGVPVIRGRPRVCASQEANIVHYLLRLGLADKRVDQLVGNLLRWQWSDGGWNCDERPEAVNSSFWETLIPLRALALYGRVAGSQDALDAAERAAEVFLKRQLFRRRRDGALMNEEFTRLHYPWYWYYDILFGLKVMDEAGFVGDPRCRDALDLLASKRLEDGGFPAEERYYHVTDKLEYGRSLVDWGASEPGSMNEFVSAEALAVLAAAGRL